MAMGKISNVLHDLKPAMMMVIVQAGAAGVNIFYKLGANDGMSLRVLIAYRFIFAAIFMAPICLLIERKSRPKLAWRVVVQAFVCGLLGGSMAQNLYAQSLVLTSATFAAAMTNLIPAITFVLAVAFRLEKLGWRTISGKAKVVGTLLCIGGAMLLTFYKGLELNIWSTRVNLLHKKSGNVVLQPSNPVLGAFLVVACCFSSALSLIIQAKMMREYPYPYSSTALMMITAAIQATVFALCMERSNWSKWKLGWNIRLLTVSYSGFVGSGVTFTLMAWCVQVRGPLFVSVFSPLMLVMVAVLGSLILNEKLHLGSVIGAVIIICGLYAVLWGKGKELKKLSQLAPITNNNRSEEKDIVVVTPSEKNNLEESTRNSTGIIGIDPHGIAALTYAESFDFKDSEEIANELKEEDKNQQRDSIISSNV